jgi:hypothetical protein
MLNVFDFYDKPSELNLSELSSSIPLLTKLEDCKLAPSDKASLEPVVNIIKKSAKLAHLYAYYIIKGRWYEAEEIIKKSPDWSFMYAYHVIKGRFEEAEPYIMKDSQWAYEYAKDILSKDPKWTSIKGHENGRWPEAEPYIMKKTNSWHTYKKYFNITE